MNFKKIIFILCCGFAVGMTNAQQSQTFTYTGSQQTWTVPCGVNSVTIEAKGAQGETGATYNAYPGGTGGDGADVVATYTVTPGGMLYVYTGGQSLFNGGGAAYSYGGGGNGGDASDVRVGGVALANRIIIAGGGGGGGAEGCTNSYSNNNGGNGGAGGMYGYVGSPGSCGGGNTYTAGQNGTLSGGGNGGLGYYDGGGGGGGGGDGGGGAGNTCSYCSFSAGSGGTGGNCGGNESNYSVNGGCLGVGGSSMYSCSTGGGGGAGYYGGGGGSAGNGNEWAGGGGGGGGSSYTGSGSNPTITDGVVTGNGEVIISWSAGGGLTVTGNVIKNVLCNGGSTGKASGIVSGGGSPYTYSWTPVVGSKDTASGLSAGNYTITVKDACGNSATASVSITQPTALSVSASASSNVLCNGESNGSASSGASGGTSPYTYAWSNLQITPNVTGLSAGTYTIGLSDANGCTATGSVSISQPNVLSLSDTVTANVSCNGESNGVGASVVSGGTSPYTYAWSNLQLTANATGLSAGTYTLGLKDANGCTASASLSITQPNPLIDSVRVLTNISCNGGTGSIAAIAQGGTSPFTYSWSPVNATTGAVTGLSAGCYSVAVIDINGCLTTSSVCLTQPNALSVSPSVLSSILCNGGSNGSLSSNASGGTSPYTYLWSNLQSSPNATGLTAGTYTLGLTDANGCTATVSVGITQPTAIVIVPSSKPDIGHDVGAAWVNVSGGVGPYTYLWNPGGNTTDSISQKDTGTYCCMVRDSNGCEDSVCIKIKLTAGIGNITSGSGDITVYPNPNNGQFTIVIAGEAKQSQDVVEIYNVLGERVYSQYLISNSQFLINLSNQPNGIYLYRVISESGSLLGEGKIMLQK